MEHTNYTPAEKQRAFMELYEPVHIRLSRFVQTLVWNPHDAKDVVSETAMIAFEQFHTVREPERFVYYLFGIASRLVKKKHRRKKFFGVFSDEYAESIPSGNGADELLLRKELYDMLNKLNDKQKEAVVLFEISGFSIKEIAELQGLSESGVKSNLKRGREKLALLLTGKRSDGKPSEKKMMQFSVERGQYGK